MTDLREELRYKIEIEKNHGKRLELLIPYIAFESMNNGNLVNLTDIENKFGIRLKPSYYDFFNEEIEMHKHFNDKLDYVYGMNEFHSYCLNADAKLYLEDAFFLIRYIIDDMGKEYYNYLEKVLNGDAIYTFKQYNDYNGFHINGKSINKDYIFMREDINKMVEYIKVFCHEFGHAYESNFMSNMSCKQQMYKGDYYFYEVISMFFEKVALEFLINNNIYKDDAHRELNNVYSELKYTFDLSDINDNIEEISDESDGEIEIELDDEYTRYLNDSYLYAYGNLISEYFLSIYREDKKAGLKMLKDFVSRQGLHDERKELETLGLYDNDLSFLNYGLNNNMEYMRKKYKW